MLASFKSEIRKLLTVRSTYVILLIDLLLTLGFISFWAYGYKDVEHAAINHGALLSSMMTTISVASIFMSFIAILLVGHEYRYNTIMYTLVASNARAKVYVSKLVTLVGFSLLFGALVTIANIGVFYIGQSLHGTNTISQHIPVSFFWHAAGTMVASTIYAFVIVMLLRNLIGAIATVLILPSTVENLLTLILHENVKYLPYNALGVFTTTGSQPHLATGLLTVAAYVIGGIIAAYLLFQKRDAN